MITFTRWPIICHIQLTSKSIWVECQEVLFKILQFLTRPMERSTWILVDVISKIRWTSLSVHWSLSFCFGLLRKTPFSAHKSWIAKPCSTNSNNLDFSVISESDIDPGYVSLNNIPIQWCAIPTKAFPVDVFL